MTTTQDTAPVATWTVWLHAQYHPGVTEVWTGTEYGKALAVAMQVIESAKDVAHTHPDWTRAAHVAGESTTNSWKITTDDDETALVFITTVSAPISTHIARFS